MYYLFHKYSIKWFADESEIDQHIQFVKDEFWCFLHKIWIENDWILLQKHKVLYLFKSKIYETE